MGLYIPPEEYETYYPKEENGDGEFQLLSTIDLNTISVNYT